MVAPGYSEKRRSFALQAGLGRKPVAQQKATKREEVGASAKRKGAAAAKKAAKAHLGTDGE